MASPHYQPVQASETGTKTQFMRKLERSIDGLIALNTQLLQNIDNLIELHTQLENGFWPVDEETTEQSAEANAEASAAPAEEDDLLDRLLSLCRTGK